MPDSEHLDSDDVAPRARRKRRWTPYSIATLIALLLAGAGAVFAGVAPASAASLAGGVGMEVFAFLVPLTVLVVAIVIEVTRLVLRNQLPDEPAISGKPFRWTARRPKL